MKKRLGFVANSSSSDFLIDDDDDERTSNWDWDLPSSNPETPVDALLTALESGSMITTTDSAVKTLDFHKTKENK